MNSDGWDPHVWPNRPLSTNEILDRVRILLHNVGDELLRAENPITWARSVGALGKLADDQRPQIMRNRVQYNLGKHQALRLQVFIQAWDEIGREND